MSSEEEAENRLKMAYAWHVYGIPKSGQITHEDMARQDRAQQTEREEALAEYRTAIERRVLAQQPCEELLQRLLGWDHFDGAADGPYWRREIEKVLTARAAQPQETSG